MGQNLWIQMYIVPMYVVQSACLPRHSVLLGVVIIHVIMCYYCAVLL